MSIVNNEHDKPEAILARKNQDDPWIMYLIVRESLNMGPGKIAAQVGHGVGMIYETYNDICLSGVLEPLDAEKSQKVSVFNSWSRSSFRKIVLRAEDKEWEKLKRQLECYLVVDAGLTEILPNSETVIVLWPMRKSLAPPLVKRLRLL